MRCENCQAEITFSMALRQAVPHRFRCPRCNARHRVQAPHLNLIFLGVVTAFVALLYPFTTGMAAHGSSFIPPFLLVAAGIWLFFEFLLHRHITRNGQLIRIDGQGAAREGSEVGPGEAGSPGEGSDGA